MSMTLKEAIKVKENHQRLHSAEYYQELLKADNLSIEAMKRLGEQRRHVTNGFTVLLPGETKE